MPELLGSILKGAKIAALVLADDQGTHYLSGDGTPLRSPPAFRADHRQSGSNPH
jgi:hypothetical protein